MSIKLKGNNESTFAQNIKTAKQVEVTDGIKFGDGTVQITAATSGGGGGDSSGSGADSWGIVNGDPSVSEANRVLNSFNVSMILTSKILINFLISFFLFFKLITK